MSCARTSGARPEGIQNSSQRKALNNGHSGWGWWWSQHQREGVQVGTVMVNVHKEHLRGLGTQCHCCRARQAHTRDLTFTILSAGPEEREG